MSPVNVDVRAGDPEVRPAFGCCVLSINSGMATLDDQFAGVAPRLRGDRNAPYSSPGTSLLEYGTVGIEQISSLLLWIRL
jgi:hypothetical protein